MVNSSKVTLVLDKFFFYANIQRIGHYKAVHISEHFVNAALHWLQCFALGLEILILLCGSYNNVQPFLLMQTKQNGIHLH